MCCRGTSLENNTIKPFFHMLLLFLALILIKHLVYTVSQYLLSSQFRPVWPGVHKHWPSIQLPPFWH